MSERSRPSILGVNILYLLLGLLLWFAGSIVQSREVYSGLLITEYIIILLPNLIYLKSKGFSLKNVLRLNTISLKQMLYVCLITIFSYPVAIFLNGIVMAIISIFTDVVPNGVPLPNNAPMYLLSIFVIAVAPGICEEVMFRGTIMSAYGRLGKKKAIIYSAILFGLFHLNLHNLIGPTFLGIILGITAYKTNSIYSSMLGHALNNGIAMTIGYFATKAQSNSIGNEVPAFEISYQLQLVMGLAMIGIFAILSACILVKLLKKLPPSEMVIEEIEDHANKTKVIHYLPIVGVLIMFILINAYYLFI